MLDAERERVQLINQEWENLKEAREMAEKKVQQLQDRLRAVRSQAKKRGNDLLGTGYFQQPLIPYLTKVQEIIKHSFLQSSDCKCNY